jgi:hypothetical protein
METTDAVAAPQPSRSKTLKHHTKPAPSFPKPEGLHCMTMDPLVERWVAGGLRFGHAQDKTASTEPSDENTYRRNSPTGLLMGHEGVFCNDHKAI